MKLQSNSRILSNLKAADLKTLASTVKETLALNLQPAVTKNFSMADLWNIQRQHKSATRKRRYFL